MKKISLFYLLSICLILISNLANSQIIFDTPLSNRVVEYNIDANLDVDKKLIVAKMKVSWINNSTDTISELQFHTYMNAFKNTASTFITESGGQLRSNSIDVNDEMAWGWIDIKKIILPNGKDITSSHKYIQPDDGNTADQTVISLRLPRRVAPGKKVTLDIYFNVKLPKVFARAGYSNNFFLVGQWFPKLGVFEKNEKGIYAWNCHQYHANSEFYADFGVYDVNITLPDSYVVGATGGLQSEKDNKDGTKTYKYRAEDVIDFAWTASEFFQVKEYDWKGVKVRILLQPEHFGLADRHTFALNAALDYFEKHIAKYPYKNLTVVDPPVGGMGAGGMEYPTFITAGTFKHIPKGVKMTEMVVIHEFGHQYFMGIIATNEFEEAWLDEGINSYMETRIMDETYGFNNSLIDFLGIRIGDGEIQRAGYVYGGASKIAETYHKSWEYTDGGYGVMSYNKPATFLMTLDNLIGRENMDKIMKKYYRDFSFKHPKTQDFIDIVNEVVKTELGDKFEDMNWFFDQVLYQTVTCDYEAKSISNHKLVGFTGAFDSGKNKNFKTADHSKNNYTSTVLLRRNGEMIMPVEILIEFDDGDKVIKEWDGKSRTHKLTFNGGRKVVSVVIDPYKKNLMDTNILNNSKVLDQEKIGILKYVFKFLFRLQNLLQTISFFA